MKVSVYAAIATALLDAFVSVLYCVKLVRREIAPRMATWLIFEIGVVMSLATYFASKEHSLVRAAMNAADAVLVTVILATILYEQRGRKIHFTRSERISLLISGVATVVWMVTRTGWIGFAGFQVVMSIAYLPTVESMWRWRAGRSPEPMEKWGINAAIALLGVIAAIADRRDYLAMVYPLRAFVLCVLVAVLIGRWNRKSMAAEAQGS